MSMSVSAAVRSPAGEPLFRLLEGTPLAQQLPPMPDLSASNDVQATHAAIMALQTLSSALGMAVDVRA